MSISSLGQYTPQGGTAGSPAVTMIPPAGTAATDMGIIVTSVKNSSVVPADPAVWNVLGNAVVGTGADGVGTGQIRLKLWFLEFTGAQGNTGINVTSSNRVIGGGQVYRKSFGDPPWYVACSFGSDVSSGTAFAAQVAANLDLRSGEWLLAYGVFTSIQTLPGRGITVPGVTGTSVGINSAGGAVGNAIFFWSDHIQSTGGTQSAASTTIATAGGATTGGTVHVIVGFARSQTIPIGQAGSQATGGVVGHAKLTAIGQAASLETAAATARRKAKTVGQASELDTGSSIHIANTRLAGRATEADTGTTATRRKALAVSRAVETSSGTLVTPRRAKAVQAATETDTAGTVARKKARTVGQAAELGTAGAITRRKTRLIGQATEADSSGSVVRPGQVGRAIEAATATALAKTKTRAVARATETATATALTRSKLTALARAVSADTATALSRGKAKAISRATEAATASVIARGKRRVAGVATEVDTAKLVRTPGQVAILGPAQESDTSAGLAVRRVIPRPTGAVVTVPGGVIPRPTGAVVPRP